MITPPLVRMESQTLRTLAPAPSSMLHLIGGPYVTIDGRPREVPQGSKRLLVFVALQHRRVERRRAAGALWPFGDDGRAGGNLRSALWRLRGAGVDVLAGDKWWLWLREGVRVDACVLADWAKRLIDGTAGDADLSAPPELGDALDLLPGWYDDWATIERERLRQRMLHALEALSGRLVAAHRWAEAVDIALISVNAEPLRESAQRALIEAHLAERNWVEALRSYQLYRRRLRRDLGVEPSEELTRLVRPVGLRSSPVLVRSASQAFRGGGFLAPRPIGDGRAATLAPASRRPLDAGQRTTVGRCDDGASPVSAERVRTS
jgi:DNA-binding SARP family transcriptional activator